MKIFAQISQDQIGHTNICHLQSLKVDQYVLKRISINVDAEKIVVLENNISGMYFSLLNLNISLGAVISAQEYC